MPDYPAIGGCRFCVIGDPVGHSLSPPMQNAAFTACKLAKRYGKLNVGTESLAEFAAFAREELDGFNITVPHKQSIIPLLDEIDSDAAQCGSVNTVKVENGRLRGYSTDGFGIEGALRRNFDLEIPGNRFLVIGAGGAARAAVWHLAGRGAAAVTIANRTRENAEKLAGDIRTAFPGIAAAACSLGDNDALRRAAVESQALIQSTSCGLHEADASPVDASILPAKGLAVFDLIYRRTGLLAAAEKRGLPHCNGLEMLLFQGARAFEIWTGLAAPEEAMRKALMEAKA